MKRVLLRAGKGAFDRVSPEDSLTRNTIATNSGNLVFSHATHKLLSVPGVEIVPNEHKVDPKQAGRISEEFDVFVVPLANAFRPGFEHKLNELTELIEKLTIPVVIFGVGAQAGLDYDLSPMAGLEDAAKRFARAVLEKSPSIGVRGELTERYFNELGFRDVDVIGCPSMFLYGDRISVTKDLPELRSDSKLALNVSPHLEVAPYFEAHPWAKTMGTLVGHHQRAYPNLVYVPQEISALDLMLWGEQAEYLGRTDELPLYATHPLYREGRMRFFVDPWTWIDFLAEQDFVFGTRIHGNITGLLAGTPSVVIAHDSRTLELARYFELPTELITDITPETDARELYQNADFGPMERGHAERFERLLDFMRRHDLACSFTDGNPEEFDLRVSETTFPDAVRPLTPQNAPTRLRALKNDTVALRRDLKRLEKKASQNGRKLQDAERERAELRSRVDELTARNQELADRLQAVEAKLRQQPWRLRRRVGRLLRRLGLRR